MDVADYLFHRGTITVLTMKSSMTYAIPPELGRCALPRPASRSLPHSTPSLGFAVGSVHSRSFVAHGQSIMYFPLTRIFKDVVST